MKTMLLSLFLVCFSLTTVLAQEGGSAMGGQSGNGGNGCWVRDISRMHWFSIEEIQFSSLLPLDPYYWRSFNRTLAVGKRGRALPLNMNVGRYNKWTLYRFDKKLKVHFPFLRERLLEWFKLYERVYVVNTKMDGLFGASKPDDRGLCDSFSPAMLSFEDGTIIVFAPVWNKLRVDSQKIMIMHEVLRFAQMFDPVFHDLSDKELVEMTASIMTSRRKINLAHSLFRRYEKRIASEGKNREDLPFAEEDYRQALGEKNSVRSFSYILKAAFHQNQESPIDYINRFRLQDEGFQELILQNIKDHFKKEE